MLSKEQKAQIVKEFGKNEKDTGSAPVQIAILTAEILELAEHMREHKHDYHSQRGLYRKIASRRKLLDYLAREDRDSYLEVLDKLGLRR
ncbi:MAG: 30S ribosomal protein S15 [Erysipelotrichaceae bacterium]|nr:30S ribosomal protein S15 [Erysipelotrichaceae bacterium]